MFAFFDTPGDFNFIVPSWWTDSSAGGINKIIGMGAGAGANCWVSPIEPRSGGAGAWVELDTVNLGPTGTIVPCHIGAGGAGTNNQTTNVGEDSWVGNSNRHNAGCIFLANGSNGGDISPGTPQWGGKFSLSKGTRGNDGANGWTNNRNNYPGVGGGGAGGPNGAGIAGGSGFGASGTSQGGNGDANFGGAGGAFNPVGNGGNGGDGTELIEGLVVAGSGGGGAGEALDPFGGVGGNGGNGGKYGGGGGIGSFILPGSFFFGGSGGKGYLLFISYPPPPRRWNVGVFRRG